MARGKYADVIPKLKRTYGQEPEYQEKINARKEQILNVVSLSPTFVSQHPGELLLVLDKTLDYWARVNELLVEVAEGRRQGASLATAYAKARFVKDRLAEQEYDLNLTIAALEQMIVEQYEAEATTSIKLDSGASVRVQHEPHATVKDREVFRQWCIKNGFERSLQLPWQTTNALTKELLLKGEPEPDGVEAKAKPKIILQKS